MTTPIPKVLGFLFAFGLGTLATTGAHAQQTGDDQGQPPPKTNSEQARRDRLARLGAGKVKHAPPIGKVYSLDALVERSMEANPELVARRYTEFYARYRQSQAEWARTPRMEFDSALTAVPNDTNFNQVEENVSEYLQFDIGPLTTNKLRLIFPLLSFGKITAAQDLAQLGVEQSEIETQKKRLLLIRQIKEAYYSVQLGKAIKAIMGDGIASIKEELARQDEAREFGDEEINVTAFRKLQIYDAELDGKVLDTDRLVRLTKAALGVLVQLDPDTFDVGPFDETLDPPPMLPLDKCVALATANRPDVTLLDKAVEARQAQVDLEKAKFIPDLYFATEFGYGFSTSKDTRQHVEVESPDGTVTSFEMPSLFDPYNYTRWSFAFGLRLRVDPAGQYWKFKQAKAKLAETRALRDAAHEGIALEIEKQWVETSDFRTRIEINHRRFKAADRWRTQMAVAFQSGGADLQDFITPLKAYYEARLLLLQAQYDYLVGVGKLAELIGVTDLEAIGHDLATPKAATGERR